MQNINYVEDYSVYGKQDLFNKYDKNALNLYFQKIWNGGKSFLVDVTGTLYDTEFKSDYKEWHSEDETISSPVASVHYTIFNAFKNGKLDCGYKKFLSIGKTE